MVKKHLILIILIIFCCKKEDEIIETKQIISNFQQKILDEINFARTNPKNYAELRLKDIDNNGSYLYIKDLIPIPSLSFDNSLNLSASNYSSFLSENNVMGHNYNGTPLKRAISDGYNGDSVGENIAASSGELFNSNNELSAINFILLMIIDMDVIDLGHRKTIFNSKYDDVGIGYSRNLNSDFVNYIVIDFGK